MRACRFIILSILVAALVQGCAAYSIDEADIRESGYGVDVPYVAQQKSYSCGAASLEMVSAYWGAAIRQEDIIAMASERDREAGFSVGGLKQIAIDRGFKAVSFAGSNQTLEDQLRKGRPVIVALSLPINKTLKSPLLRELPQSKGAAWFMDQYSHFVVVVGMTGSEVIVMDPLTGIDKYSLREFEERWNQRSHAALLITS